MTPNDVLTFYKSYHYFGKETGMSPSTLWNWCKQGFVPMPSQKKIEGFTDGVLRADPKHGKDFNDEK